MSSQIPAQIARLQRQMRNTRLAGLLGFLGLGTGLGWGIHHLGQVHHEAFPNYYEKGKAKRAESTPDTIPFIPIPLIPRVPPELRPDPLRSFRKDLQEKYNGSTGDQTGDTDHRAGDLGVRGDT